MFDIILPIYKIEPHILELCLESIEHQTISDYKVWIIDGTPVDWKDYEGLMDVISKFIERFEHCAYVEQTGNGISQARNQGIMKGDNPYLAFIDGDDFWYPSHLENLQKSIFTSSAETVVWWDLAVYPLIMDGGKRMFVKQFDYENVIYCDNLKQILEEYIILPSTSVIRRERAENVGLFDVDLWGREDIEFFIRLASDTYQGIFINSFGCIALWSTNDRKVEDFDSKDLFSEKVLFKKHPHFNFEMLEHQTNRRYILVFDDNEEKYPNESVIDLCVELLPFNLSDSSRLIQG